MRPQSIEIDGRRRRYLHVAPTTPSPGAPLLVALHGTSQRGVTMRKFSGRTLDVLAERIGADLLYLDGYHRAWNDARKMKFSAAQKRNIDDVGFVRGVVARFDRPVIAIGYSNGGQLAHRVLREAPDVLAGAAIIAAGLPVDSDNLFAGVQPADVPVLLLHGTADPVVPYEGGSTRFLGRARGPVMSAMATAEAYAPDGTIPTVSRVGEIERADWGSVRLVTQFGVGHIIPNRLTSPSPRFVGSSHQDLDTGEEVARFFSL